MLDELYQLINSKKMINPHMSFRPYSLNKGNNHFMKRQMYALKEAHSRLSQAKEKNRVQTPCKERSAKRNSMKYRKRKYDLITFQAASTRDDTNIYKNGVRESVNGNIQGYKKIHIFENIPAPETHFNIFRATPENSKPKEGQASRFRESEIGLNNKFTRALKKSITNERFKRKQVIRNNFEITSLKRLQEERNFNLALNK